MHLCIAIFTKLIFLALENFQPNTQIQMFGFFPRDI